MDWISATAELRQLRDEFPGWGIFHDPYVVRWVAVRGNAESLVADTPSDLRWRLLATVDPAQH